jgi:hypothetical protein
MGTGSQHTQNPMDIYYLLPPTQKPLRVLSNPCGASRIVRTKGTATQAWLNARQAAIEDAAGRGVRSVLVVVGHCSDVRHVQRRDWSKLRYPEVERTYAADKRWDHSMITYMERLLHDYAAMVMVPPLGAVVDNPWSEHTPTLPMVAGYRVAAAMSVDMAGSSPGYELSCLGYRTLTLHDYGFHMVGKPVFDEYGTTKKWKKAYDHAIEELLGVCPRNKRER